ncbi:MAG: J domain-containing protein [Microthrixaceae bacterium]|nr:J domain-containing protein [Microthrixaceae bacterium]
MEITEILQLGTSTAESTSDSDVPFDVASTSPLVTPMEQPMYPSDNEDSRPTQRRGASETFPGGRTRLPRIKRPGGHASGVNGIQEPEVLVTASAFMAQGTPSANRKNTHRVMSSGDDTEFGQYYSSDSLFDTSRETDVTSTTSDGPYAVLGLTRQASWEQIRRAHRSLVSTLHPDRYVGESPEVIAHAEQRVRDVNEAFAEIRRQRSGGAR